MVSLSVTRAPLDSTVSGGPGGSQDKLSSRSYASQVCHLYTSKQKQVASFSFLVWKKMCLDKEEDAGIGEASGPVVMVLILAVDLTASGIS